jgi:hypothetical protein
MQDDGSNNSIAGVASSLPAIGIVMDVETAIKRLELAPGLESGIYWRDGGELKLLTPDPRLHLLGERADLQKSVCSSMLP